MSETRQGQTVRVHYTGRLEDGTVFDSSRGGEPIEFTVGEGRVIPGFESVVAEMQVGEEKTAVIPATEAYGPRREELLLTVEKEQLPEQVEPAVGQRLHMTTADEQTVTVVIAEVEAETVTLDANHPLAGKDLVFELELVEVA